MTAALAAPGVAFDARPVATYTRISSDRNDKGRGSGLGVARQAEACQECADRNGYAGRDMALYTDNDRSGWDPAKVRPEFERLLADIAAGTYAAVFAFHLDRMSRQPMQHELLWAACRKAGTRLITVVGGPIESPLMMRIVSAMAAEESDVKSARITSKHGELAKAGKPHGGRRRFGFEPDGITHRPSEVAVISELADRVLAGESLRSVTRWLNDDLGMLTPSQGKRWTSPNVGAMLRGAHLAGLRVHRGVITGPAVWAPVIDRGRWEALQRVLGAPGRRAERAGTGRVHLLTGIIECGACGGFLHGRQYKGTVIYVCRACGGVQRSAERVDGIVTDWVIARLSRVDAAGTLVDDRDAEALAVLERDRAAVEDRRALMAGDYAAGRLSLPDFQALSAAIAAEAARLDDLIGATRARLAAPERELAGLTGPDPELTWEDLTLDRRRAVVRALCRVRLAKATRQTFRRELVEIVATTA